MMTGVTPKAVTAQLASIDITGVSPVTRSGHVYGRETCEIGKKVKSKAQTSGKAVVIKEVSEKK